MMISKLRLRVFALLTVMVLAPCPLLTHGAIAGEMGDIAFVNIKALESGSEAARSIQTRFDQLRQEFQQSVAAEEQDFDARKADLAKQRTLVAETVFAGKIKELETEYKDILAKRNERKSRLEEALTHARVDLRKKLLGVIASIARDSDLNMVLSSEMIVLGEKSFDITDEAMARLNKEVPEIVVELSKIKDKASK
ncbi:MAG: OmpH family outer membrane protein [Pseudomonadota bacterium]|nr:OmpH family outer membrane protein [Pseudomonadota bacterium]